MSNEALVISIDPLFYVLVFPLAYYRWICFRVVMCKKFMNRAQPVLTLRIGASYNHLDL